MAVTLLVDIGKIYTKCFILNSENELDFEICFPTIVKKAEKILSDFNYYKDYSTKDYLNVGFEAAYESEYSDIITKDESEHSDIITKNEFGAGISSDLVYAVVSKILFENIKNKSFVNLIFIVDKEQNYNFLNEQDIFEVFGIVFKKHKTKQYKVNVKYLTAASVLKNYFLNSYQDYILDVVLVVDIGFCKTRIYIINNKNNNVSFFELKNGVNYYLTKLKDYFENEEVYFNPFVILKELECKNTIIKTQMGDFDIKPAFENIRYDLNKLLVNEMEKILNQFYTSYLVWPDLLYITGGGSAFNGEIMVLDLFKRINGFNHVEVDSSPRFSLLNKYL